MTLVALALASHAVRAQQQPAPDEGAPHEETTLTGLLTTDASAAYVLFEERSGEAVALVSVGDLADYIGSRVKVTGRFMRDEDTGDRYFEVREVRPAS